MRDDKRTAKAETMRRKAIRREKYGTTRTATRKAA